MQQNTFVTSGDIARALDSGADRVRHVLSSRRDIQPVGRAGIAWLYERDVVDRVRSELQQIEAKRLK